MYDKASKRIEKLLEVENFLKTSAVMRHAFKLMFSRTERYLLHNQKSFILRETSGSESSESSDSDFEPDAKAFAKNPDDQHFELLLKGTKPKPKRSAEPDLNLSKTHESEE